MRSGNGISCLLRFSTSVSRPAPRTFAGCGQVSLSPPDHSGGDRLSGKWGGYQRLRSPPDSPLVSAVTPAPVLQAGLRPWSLKQYGTRNLSPILCVFLCWCDGTKSHPGGQPAQDAWHQGSSQNLRCSEPNPGESRPHSASLVTHLLPTEVTGLGFPLWLSG